MFNENAEKQSSEELRELLHSVVKELLEKSNLQNGKQEKELLSRKETANYFSISNNCLHDWVKKGILYPYKISGRTYFKLSELRTIAKKD